MKPLKRYVEVSSLSLFLSLFNRLIKMIKSIQNPAWCLQHGESGETLAYANSRVACSQD